jgi:hypothetical protein
MGRVAEQNQAAGEPAPTVHAADGIDQQVIERRHPPQQIRRRWEHPSPLLAKGRKVAARHRLSSPGYDYGDEYKFGLDLILEGLEKNVPQRT